MRVSVATSRLCRTHQRRDPGPKSTSDVAKKDAGDPTDILRNIAEFHSCINLMIHCFATTGGTSPNL